MSGNKCATPTEWVDPDDAPELDDTFFENGVWCIGEKVVSKEEAQAANEARGDWLKDHRPA